MYYYCTSNMTNPEPSKCLYRCNGTATFFLCRTLIYHGGNDFWSRVYRSVFGAERARSNKARARFFKYD
jgi:hypothetical protein